MKRFILSMAGAASLLASASILIDYGTRKENAREAHPAELTAGIVGAVAGVALAALAEIKLPKKAPKEELGDLLGEDDFALLDENLSEVLGDEDATIPVIELDEETSIEDFI
ncbi:MAG: hypothetical protein IJW30_04210 [Clostridia bacterium]|nr:hypothetical protein [Clostridia bacterium]